MRNALLDLLSLVCLVLAELRCDDEPDSNSLLQPTQPLTPTVMTVIGDGVDPWEAYKNYERLERMRRPQLLKGSLLELDENLTPWMTPEETDFLGRSLSTADAFLEFGTGGSTTFAAGYPNIKCMKGVESSSAWVATVSADPLVKEGISQGRIELHYVDIGPIREAGHPTDPSTRDRDLDSFVKNLEALDHLTRSRSPSKKMLSWKRKRSNAAITKETSIFGQPVLVQLGDEVRSRALQEEQGTVVLLSMRRREPLRRLLLSFQVDLDANIRSWCHLLRFGSLRSSKSSSYNFSKIWKWITAVLGGGRPSIIAKKRVETPCLISTPGQKELQASLSWIAVARSGARRRPFVVKTKARNLVDWTFARS